MGSFGFFLSRRAAMLAGIAAGVGSLARRARAQGSGDMETIDMTGRTALVTGSTDGLGREVALRLGAMGADVIVHGRNRERGAEVVAQIESGTPGSAVFYRADFASLDAVRELADTIATNHERLDLLINNAGIWTDGTGQRRESDDGHELVFAVNYLAGFLLTHRLLPMLERSTPARIVNVSSLAQQPIDFDNVMLTDGFSASRAYAQSKLAQAMFTIDLAHRLDGTGVIANALHPATMMDTSMVEDAGATPRSTVDEGADAVMQLAVGAALEGESGLFFNGLAESRANDQAYDVEARQRLAALSRELTGIGMG